MNDVTPFSMMVGARFVASQYETDCVTVQYKNLRNRYSDHVFILRCIQQRTMKTFSHEFQATAAKRFVPDFLGHLFVAVCCRSFIVVGEQLSYSERMGEVIYFGKRRKTEDGRCKCPHGEKSGATEKYGAEAGTWSAAT